MGESMSVERLAKMLKSSADEDEGHGFQHTGLEGEIIRDRKCHAIPPPFV